MATISASNLTFIIFWMKLKIFPIYRFLPSPTFWNFEVDNNNNNSNESNYKKQQVDDDERSKKERTLHHTHRLQNIANTGIRTQDLASELGSK